MNKKMDKELIIERLPWALLGAMTVTFCASFIFNGAGVYFFGLAVTFAVVWVYIGVRKFDNPSDLLDCCYCETCQMCWYGDSACCHACGSPDVIVCYTDVEEARKALDIAIMDM